MIAVGAGRSDSAIEAMHGHNYKVRWIVTVLHFNLISKALNRATRY